MLSVQEAQKILGLRPQCELKEVLQVPTSITHLFRAGLALTILLAHFVEIRENVQGQRSCERRLLLLAVQGGARQGGAGGRDGQGHAASLSEGVPSFGDGNHKSLYISAFFQTTNTLLCNHRNAPSLHPSIHLLSGQQQSQQPKVELSLAYGEKGQNTKCEGCQWTFGLNRCHSL